MKVMTCNVHKTSDPVVVAKWMRELLGEIGPDVVLLQELTPRHTSALKVRTGGSHRLFVGNERPGANEVGVLVHRDHKVTRDYNVPLGHQRWLGRHTGRLHTPRNMRVVQLRSGLHLASVHLPPGVDCTPHGLTGPKDRQKAWKQSYTRFRTWASHDFDFVAGGDWNEHAGVRFPWSPRALAREIRDRVELPIELHTLGTIDYVMSRGLDVRPLRLIHDVPEGFDHTPGLYRVDSAT